MFKQSHRTILDKITFLFFNINFAKGDFVRSTFANIRTTQKFSGYILYMSYCLLIASDPDYITYPSRTKQSDFGENQHFQPLQRVILCVAPFANVLTTQKMYEYILYMSYYPMIVSDPTCFAYPSRTKQSNV